MLKKALKFVTVLFSVLALGACVTLTPAKDVPERIAYGFASAAAAANTAVYMLQTQKITKEQGYTIYTKLVEVDKYLNKAKELYDLGLPTEATKQIDLAMFILNKIEAELKEKEANKAISSSSLEVNYVSI